MKYYFRCPRCRSDEHFVTPSEQPSDLGCLLLLFGGILSALLYAGSRLGRIQCVRCGHIFKQPALPTSPLAKFAGWISALAILFVMIAGFWYFIGGTVLPPSIPVMESIEEAVIAQPRLAAYLLALLFILIVIPSWVAACLSNAKFRDRLATRYRLTPSSSNEFYRRNRLLLDASMESPHADPPNPPTDGPATPSGDGDGLDEGRNR